jgi:hypothetical protein
MIEQRFLHPTDRRKAQRKLYGSQRWERVRAMVLERDGYMCQVKASKKCRTTANVVDHIIRPEEGGEPYDPANLRASCRSCNMVRHNAAYFREKVDAAAAGSASPPISSSSGVGSFIRPQPASGRPSTADRGFIPWVMGLHGVSGEPQDHHHGRWDVAPSITLNRLAFRVCPASCSSPVRWAA